MPEIIIGNEQQIITETQVVTSQFVFSWDLLFYFGMIVTAVIFSYKICKIILTIYKNPKRWSGNLLIVKVINSTKAFSFFHYIFLGENIKPEDQSIILNHEFVHVTQKHTLDLLVFELFKIIFWFNPLIYMYQSRIATVHEFIADAKAVKHQSKKAYYNNLLAQVFDTQKLSFINPFFKQSLIKKRMVLLTIYV